MILSKSIYSLLVILILFYAQGSDAARRKSNNKGGASMGDVEDSENINVFTSPGAKQALAALENLIDMKEDFEMLRTQGPIEEALVSPFQEAPAEEGQVLVGSVSTNATDRRMLNVFLPDTRVDVDNTAYPYRTVGLYGGCTGTLVYDQGIMVTNAHCLTFKKDGSFDPSNWNRAFYAGFKNGNYLASSKPKAIYYHKGNDYAVLKLFDYIDSQVGRMGVHWRSASWFYINRPLQMVSYSGDHCTAWLNCKSMLSSGISRGVYKGNVLHDLDATRGSSGSSLFWWYNGWPVVQALNFAEYRNGGEVSLVLPSYTGSNPNVAKPSALFKYGYDKVKIY